MTEAKANTWPGEPDDGQRDARGVSVLMMATSIAVICLGVAAVYAALGLGVGTLVDPGPGLWPFVLGAALVGLGLFTVVADRHLPPEPFTSRSWRFVIAVIICGAYVELFVALGPTVPTFVFMFSWLRWLSRRSWRSSLVLSLAITAVVYLVFALALGISLPTDLLLALR